MLKYDKKIKNHHVHPFPSHFRSLQQFLSSLHTSRPPAPASVAADLGAGLEARPHGVDVDHLLLVAAREMYHGEISVHIIYIYIYIHIYIYVCVCVCVCM